MIRQRTIKDPVTVEGIGLQTGKRVRLTLKSSPANSGINFIRIDLPNKPLLNVRAAAFKSRPSIFERRTTLSIGPLQIQTTEHLLAALSGMSVDNIVVELDSEELPGLDGSARGFLDLIKQGKVVEQDVPKRIIKVTAPVWCKDADRLLAVFPDDDFRVSYTLSYVSPALGDQFFSITVNENTFETEIAPARTFCLEEEALALLKKGLGKGANYDNTLVLGPAGPISTKERFADEPVRHKILDLIGDISLLGGRLAGHIVAIKSGHALNMELVKKLQEI